MTVIAEHDLISEYTLFDPVIRERLDNFDTDSTCWEEYDFLGEGGEREAWLDKTTNLVYKRLHTDSRTLYMPYTDLFQEIPSLDKAHRFLREHPEYGVRYAETYYYTNAQGKQFMVQEYVDSLGDHTLTPSFCDVLMDIDSDTGISDDSYEMNFGRDADGTIVLTDMLEV